MTRGSCAEMGSLGWEVSQPPTPNPARRRPAHIGVTARARPYHEKEAPEGGRAMDMETREARGSSGFLHSEHHISRAPCCCRAPRLQLTHQHIHKVFTVGGGQGSVGQ